MTDEIIIDGIDVSECKYFCKFTSICRNENIGRVVRPRCKNVIACYYKQLKHKEQECSSLTSQLDFVVQQKECLEQECKELKQTIRAYQEDRFCQGGCSIYQYDKIHELTQTLDKIEQICKEGSYDEYKMPLDECDVILDLINKVKDNK